MLSRGRRAWRIHGIVPAILGVLIGAVDARAQQQRPSPELATVLVSEFRYAGGGSPRAAYRKLGSLAADIIELRLHGVGGLAVERWSQTERCPTGQDRNRTDLAQQATTEVAQELPDGVFYLVAGDIRVVAGESDVSYRILRCGGVRGDSLLLARRESFGREAALDQLTAIAHRTGELLKALRPAVAVHLVPFEDKGGAKDGLRMARRITATVLDSLLASADFEVANPGAYRATGTIETKNDDVVRANVLIFAGDGKQPFTSPPILGSRSQLAVFYNRVASQALLSLTRVRLSREVGDDLLLKNAHDLVRHARRYLCEPPEPSCRPNLEAAVTAARSAASADPSRWDAWLLMGIAEFRTGGSWAARSALRKAQRLQSGARDATGGDRVRLLTALGDVHVALSNYGEATRQYRAALDLDPARGEGYVSLARAFRLDGKTADAWRTMRTAVSRGIPWELFDAESVELLRDAEPSTVADSIEGVLELCADRGRVHAHIKAECIEILTETGRTLYNAGTDVATVRTLFQAVLRLDPPEPTVLVEANAFLGGSFLGQTTVNLNETGCVRLSHERFDFQQADRFLRAAEERVTDAKAGPGTREWLTRLRALYWFRSNQHEKAAVWIEKALQQQSTNPATYVTGQVAFILGRKAQESRFGNCGPTQQLPVGVRRQYEKTYEAMALLVDRRYEGADWYFREAGHSLGRDEETRARFDSVPEDRTALRSLYFVCGEYLKNFFCAFDAARRLVGTGATLDHGERLDVGEAALRVDSFAVAREWMGPLLTGPSQGLIARFRVVLEVLKTWLAAGEGSHRVAMHAFEAWREEAKAFRRDGQHLGWTFEGSRVAVDSSSLNRCYRDLLRKMFDVTEDESGTKPIPEQFPPCQ